MNLHYRPGALRPPDPLRWRLPSRYPLIPPRTKILEPPMAGVYSRRTFPLSPKPKCRKLLFLWLIVLMCRFSEQKKSGTKMENFLTISYLHFFIVLMHCLDFYLECRSTIIQISQLPSFGVSNIFAALQLRLIIRRVNLYLQERIHIHTGSNVIPVHDKSIK